MRRRGAPRVDNPIPVFDAYSVIASCELVDVNPEECLAEVLPRLARDGVTIADLGAMLPASWKVARAIRAAATVAKA